MHILGFIVLGTGGAVAASNPKIGLPPGFDFPSGSGADGNMSIGTVFLSDSDAAANRRLAEVTNWGGGVLRFAYSANPGALTALNVTAPFTWAVGDMMRWTLSSQMVRV